MIEITLNTARLKLQIKGHALAEETADHSAICTAASALAQGMLYSISKMDDAEGALRSLQYKNDPGDMFILAIPEQWAENMIKRRFRVYGDGLELLAKSHPESITMIWDGEKILPDKEGET